MFVERKLNQSTGAVEMWECEWENRAGAPAKKVFIKKIADEQPLAPENKSVLNQAAICWSYGRTLGNIAVFSPSVLGSFTASSGSDAVLACDLVNAGKFRHGADRWWCRTHQTHWGKQADYEAYAQTGILVCANHAQRMNYVVSPLQIDVTEYAEVGIWCSLPPARSSNKILPRPPRIHVHLRQQAGGVKKIDKDWPAISIVYNQNLGLFANPEITRVNVTPPAALEFLRALEFGREMDCINCSHCGYPHLDLGDFAETPHRKHFCGNCGHDSTWSKKPIVSTPLKPLHDSLGGQVESKWATRELNLDAFARHNYDLWASTPAVMWTADRVEEKGIHVHIHDGKRRIVDDTFGKVMLGGSELNREELLAEMFSRVII